MNYLYRWEAIFSRAVILRSWFGCDDMILQLRSNFCLHRLTKVPSNKFKKEHVYVLDYSKAMTFGVNGEIDLSHNELRVTSQDVRKYM